MTYDAINGAWYGTWDDGDVLKLNVMMFESDLLLDI